MKIRIVISLLLAALTLTNSNIALSEEKTASNSKTNKSEVCVDEDGNKYPCP